MQDFPTGLALGVAAHPAFLTPALTSLGTPADDAAAHRVHMQHFTAG
jgi:hypothetical protein